MCGRSRCHAQADFGERVADICGAAMKLHVFCFDLPHSDACFVKAYAAETMEAFLDGHESAFAFSAAFRRRSRSPQRRCWATASDDAPRLSLNSSAMFCSTIVSVAFRRRNLPSSGSELRIANCKRCVPSPG
jgi:transposase